jgi:hypothetical protein
MNDFLTSFHSPRVWLCVALPLAQILLLVTFVIAYIA